MLQSWAEDAETAFVAALPDVINLACIKCARDLQIEKFRLRATGSFVASTATITMPTDAIAIDGFIVNDGTNNYPLSERSSELIDLYNSAEGLPVYFCEQDVDTIRVAPTPDDTYTYAILGMQRPEELVVTTNETNWLTDNVPDLLFLACLQWSELFRKDDNRAQMWREQYTQELNTARLEFGEEARVTDEEAQS